MKKKKYKINKSVLAFVSIIALILALGLFAECKCNDCAGNQTLESLLDSRNLTISCKEYEQIPVTRFNNTCKSLLTGYFFNNTPAKIYYRITEEKGCSNNYEEVIKSEPVEIKINGECIEYKIIPKVNLIKGFIFTIGG